jgi:hypothetical protein
MFKLQEKTDQSTKTTFRGLKVRDQSKLQQDLPRSLTKENKRRVNVLNPQQKKLTDKTDSNMQINHSKVHLQSL